MRWLIQIKSGRVGKQKDACPPYETVIVMIRSVFGFAEASLPDIFVGIFTDMIFFLLVPEQNEDKIKKINTVSFKITAANFYYS